MMNLIRFLIMVTQTVDGRQNTGSKILKTLNLQDQKNYKNEFQTQEVSKPIRDRI